jgi:hypothetical protein
VDECKPLVKGKGVMHTFFVDGIVEAVEPNALRAALTRVGTTTDCPPRRPTRVTRYPISMWEMTISILSSPIS